ncbi:MULTISPECIES: hypothetical protein [unclassified Streptomyces]|uniref:hypothetical protein n=1 Tax=unclassified Streptomyces TaxID=2593676 RepID=UPI0006ADB662|nr:MULTISPECIES: hypothetical protein [unclassified Streptomyces]KOX16565.1 hypothetical protein ADL06_33200 [Streptomyces sp. NRRL F-6491]KOX36107.1 hypothetical protein ADL08_33540 [Streptomyces sp. NRRL F-6492]
MTRHARTRADSRRGRTLLRDLSRDERRARFLLLLARADRGVLTPEDCAQLRLDIEAEVSESDTHRRSAAGQQAAAMRLHSRIEAAEQALVETESDRDQAAAEAEHLRQQLAVGGQR